MALRAAVTEIRSRIDLHDDKHNREMDGLAAVLEAAISCAVFAERRGDEWEAHTAPWLVALVALARTICDGSGWSYW